MKKLLIALFCISLIASAASAAETHKIGVLAKLNMTQEEYKNFEDARFSAGQSLFFSTSKHDAEKIYVFYDSLVALQLALNAGEIDVMQLPEDIAEYVMNVTGKYHAVAISKTTPMILAFGFRANDDPKMRNDFNTALLAMKADGTLAVLEAKYVSDAGIDAPEQVKPDHYDNVDKTIKVAVTGDLPPIDFVAPDGTPAGFNTAVVAEIAKRLKVNVEFVDIDAGARAANLVSGRVDAVFWFQSYKNLDGTQPDIPEGIVLSEPYYQWNEYLQLAK